MGIFPCLSPQAGSSKAIKHKNELTVVKAELTEAKAIIAELQSGVGAFCTPATVTRPATVSVGVQVQPPVECWSRIPRPEELVTRRASASDLITKPAQSTYRADCRGSSAAQQLSTTDKKDQPNTPQRSSYGLQGSRIPAMPPRRSVGRSQSAKNAATKGGTPAAAVVRAATVDEVPTLSPEFPVQAHCEAAVSSQHARAMILSKQLKVSEAFRQSLESELRTLRLRSAALQTQVLSLQTTLERSMQTQVDELDKLAKLRKGGDAGAYEQAVAEAAALKRQLETSEALNAVAQQQAQTATELATTRQEQLSATQTELAALKDGAAATHIRCLELVAEGAQLKQTTLTLNKAHARVEELEGALTATAQQSTQAEADLHQQISKLREELRKQKAITDSTCAELLSLSDAHSTLKQAHSKLELEIKQHDQVVQIVQQELADMSYFAAAGRVALGLCASDSGLLASTGQSVTPTADSPRVCTAAAHPQPGDGVRGKKDPLLTEQAGAEVSMGHHCMVSEDRSAISIAAAAAAGAAAVISIAPGSSLLVSKFAAAAEKGAPPTCEQVSAPAGDGDAEKEQGTGCVADPIEGAGVKEVAESEEDQPASAACQAEPAERSPALVHEPAPQ